MSGIGGAGIPEDQASLIRDLMAGIADSVASIGSEETAAPVAAARPAGAYGPPLELGGAKIDRIAPPPTPASENQTKALGKLRQSLLEVPPNFEQWRSKGWADKVAKMDPVLGRGGEKLSLGRLAIVRPGGTNITPGPAFLCRLAQHVDEPDGKVVIAYQNFSDPKQNVLHQVDTYDGVPIPEKLRGKIWAIGSPEPCAIAYDQCSDQFIEALELMRRQKDKLGFDPLTAKATVLGNSEGTLDVPLTRKRLNHAGFPDAIGRTVAITSGANGGWAGDKWVSVNVAGTLTAVMGDALGPPNPDWKRYMDVLNERELRRNFTPEMKDLVDLSISATIGQGTLAFGVFGTPETHHNIRPGMRLAATVDNFAKFLSKPSLRTLGEAVTGGSSESDGLLTVGMGRFGKRVITMKDPHDHAGMIEDPAVVDEILRNLPR